MVYIQDPDMHIGRQFSSECSHRVSETSIYSCYLFTYCLVALVGITSLEYEDTIFPHTLGMVVDLLLAKPANVDLSFEISVERFLSII